MSIWVHLFIPLTVGSIFFLDRLTKSWVSKLLEQGELPFFQLPFFQIIYVENTGAAFGIGQNKNTIFIILSIIILIILLIMIRNSPKNNRPMRFGFALVVGGALGNMYDRIAYGSVIDFLDVFVGTHHWPTFNIADSAICIGATFLAITHWNEKKHHIEETAE